MKTQNRKTFYKKKDSAGNIIRSNLNQVQYSQHYNKAKTKKIPTRSLSHQHTSKESSEEKITVDQHETRKGRGKHSISEIQVRTLNVNGLGDDNKRNKALKKSGQKKR